MLCLCSIERRFVFRSRSAQIGSKYFAYEVGLTAKNAGAENILEFFSEFFPILTRTSDNIYRTRRIGPTRSERKNKRKDKNYLGGAA